jgi:hemolysin activation/secretion protein
MFIRSLKTLAIIALLVTCLNAPLGFAQEISSEVLRQQELLEEESTLRQKINSPEKVFIEKISVSGAELLGESQIHEITLAFEGHWLAKEDIQQIINALTQAYKKKGIDLAADAITAEAKDNILNIGIKSVKNG